MHRIAIALLATIALATPALAQGLYIGAGPGGIGVSVGPGYEGAATDITTGTTRVGIRTPRIVGGSRLRPAAASAK